MFVDWLFGVMDKIDCEDLFQAYWSLMRTKTYSSPEVDATAMTCNALNC